MRIVSMRTVAGEAPAIMAEPGPGESPTEGATVEGGSGVITLVGTANISVRAVEMFVPESSPPESLGFVLARRIRDGLKTLTIDGGT
jgi:hypothetical protein